MAVEFEPEVKIDMTPMIDCIFQLIMFFMLTLKIAQDDIIALELPIAEMAQKDETDDPNRLIVNIAQGTSTAGTPYKIVVSGFDLTPPKENGKWRIKGTQFEKRIIQAAGLGSKSFSDRQVLIRADEEVPYEYVAMVMAALTGPNVKIFRIQIGAAKRE